MKINLVGLEKKDFFALVDKNKYPDVTQKYRFEKIK